MPLDKKTNRYFVQIFARTAEQLRNLEQQYHLDVFIASAKLSEDGRYVVDGLLSAEQIDTVRTRGYNVIVTANAERLAKDRLKEIARKE